MLLLMLMWMLLHTLLWLESLSPGATLSSEYDVVSYYVDGVTGSDFTAAFWEAHLLYLGLTFLPHSLAERTLGLLVEPHSPMENQT